MGSRLNKPVKILCLALLAVFLFFHCFLFWSRFQYQAGVNRMHDKEWDQALICFEKAEKSLPFFIPGFYTLQDRFRIFSKKGEALNEKALAMLKENGPTIWALTTYREARETLQKAVTINPDVYVPAYWLARTENSLELLYPRLFPRKDNPYNADSYYQNAIRLWPNGITVHYSYARYLAAVQDTEALAPTIRRMMEIFPNAYHHLKKEPFFSHDLMLEMEKGLEAAQKAGTNPRETLQALADIYSQKGEDEKAVQAFEKSLTIRRFANTSHTFARMGVLLLRADQPDEARTFFIQALKTSEDFEKTLSHIRYLHKKETQVKAFITLILDYEKSHPANPLLDLAIARAWMDMDSYSFAKTRLLQLNEKKENAEALYLLALIAEKEADWDSMELSAQRATVLNKENPQYFYLFSKALHRQKKYTSAEAAATRAIELSDKANPWFFSHRAWTRWHLKQYEKAISDWSRAFDIKPDYANYPFWMAMAYEKENMTAQSRVLLQKALALDPDNDNYLKFAERLESKIK